MAGSIPWSNQAGSVVDVLRLAAAGRGISLRTDCQVTALRQTAAGFALELGEQRLLADKVIVCSGGLAPVGRLAAAAAAMRCCKDWDIACSPGYILH